MISWEHYKVS